jgi:hypothetical protein
MALERDKFVISYRNTRLVMSLAQRVLNSTANKAFDLIEVAHFAFEEDCRSSFYNSLNVSPTLGEHRCWSQSGHKTVATSTG